MTQKLTIGLLSLCLGATAWALGPKDKDKDKDASADNELQRATDTVSPHDLRRPRYGRPQQCSRRRKVQVAVIP